MCRYVEKTTPRAAPHVRAYLMSVVGFMSPQRMERGCGEKQLWGGGK